MVLLHVENKGLISQNVLFYTPIFFTLSWTFTTQEGSQKLGVQRKQLGIGQKPVNEINQISESQDSILSLIDESRFWV